MTIHQRPQRAGHETLVRLAQYRAATQPDHKAFIFLRSGENEAGHLTFSELDLKARSIAARLQQVFRPGDRVLLSYASARDFICAFFGCLYAKVVAVPTLAPNSTLEVARLARIGADAGAAGLCMGTAGFNDAHLAMADPRTKKRLRCLTTSHDSGEYAGQWVEPDIDAHCLACLHYTAGSTGVIKGVMISHAHLLHSQCLIEKVFEHSSRSIGVSWLPLHNEMGLIGHVIQTVHLGSTSVLMTPAAFISRPVRWLQAITRYRATTSGGPDFAYELCSRRIPSDQMPGLDLRSWDVAFNGAEPVRSETLKRFADKFAVCGFRRDAFMSCYGLAEATLFVSGTERHREPRVCLVDADELCQHRVLPADGTTRKARSVVSCGRALHKQVLIVDPGTLRVCPEDRVGEIWIQGDGVAAGYWNKPALTRAAFKGRLADSRGQPCLRTGDLGFVRNGEIYVTGRLKDLIVIAGRHYYPQDIENTVSASHALLSGGTSAAFSVGVEGADRLIVMHELQLNSVRDMARAEVLRAARQALESEMGLALQEVVLMPHGSLPRTASGAVCRGASRDVYVRRARPGSQV